MSQNASPTVTIDPHASELRTFNGYQVFVILILATLQFTIILDFMIISPLGDLLMKNLNLNPGEFGSVVSAYAISAGVSGILTAGFADKFDRKKLLLFFYIGFIVGTLFCGLAWNYMTLFLARLVTGVFGGVVGSIILAIVTDVFALRQRGRVMGYVQMAFAGSQILGVPIGIVVANAWGWHATFFMVALVASLVCISIIIFMKPLTGHLAMQHDRSVLQHLWHTIRKRDHRVGFLATATLSMGGFMLMPFSSAFLVNNVTITQEQLPLVFFFTGISSMVVMPLIGRWSDVQDKFRIFTIGSLVAAVMILIYTNLGPASLWMVIGINVILFMGIMGRVVPATTLNTAVPDQQDRGAYMSINNSLRQMAGGFAAMLAGVIVVQENSHAPIGHYNWLGAIVVGFVLLGIYLVWRMDKLVKAKRATRGVE